MIILEKNKSRPRSSLDERLFGLAAFLALVLMVDPRRAQWGAAQIPLLKYSPVILGIMAFILSVLLKPRIRFSKWQGMVLLLAIEMVSGGLYSFYLGSEPANTWLGRGLIALVFLVTLKIAERGLQVDLKAMVGVTYIVMILITWAFWLGRLPWPFLTQVYHTEAVFLFAAGWALLLSARRYRIFWLFCLILMITGLVLVGKYTTYVLLSVSLILNLLLVFPQKISKRRRNSLLVLLGMLALVAMFFIGREIAQARLAERAVVVRATTFEARVVAFQQHPWFGSFFVGDPILRVGDLVIPSHSDVLDLLSFGGILAGFLFFFPVSKILVDALKKFNDLGRKLSDPSQWMVVFSIYFVTLFLVTMIVNPILGVPYLGFWFWACLGYLSVFVTKGKNNEYQSHR